ncbi:hypothetical protein [Aquipuribacter nitratireducens]|uniref:Permease n=1 Tax=Aquipuribacter nitratireducens TaxID=650104 RepID=A0ABW0GL17_9MICO
MSTDYELADRPPSPPAAPATSAAPQGHPGRVALTWTLTVLAWGGAVLALSVSGALARLPLTVLPLLVVLGIALPLLGVRLDPTSRRAVAEVDIAHLTWFNAWRVPAALVFFAVGARGLLPPQFVANAAWGDLVAGALAPLVVLVGARLHGAARRRAYLGFHLFSFGDFVVAVGTGLAFTLLGDPLMRTLLETPMALIPLWGVPLTGAVSLLALHRLLGRDPRP